METTVQSEDPSEVLQKEQMEIERECVGAGVSQYRERLKRQQEKGLLTLSKPERDLLQSAEAVREGLIERIRESRKKPGQRAVAVRMVEDIADADVAAVVALRTVIDGLSQVRRVQSVAVRIGKAIEIENRLEAFEKTNPALYKRIEQHIAENPRRWDPNYRSRVRVHAVRKYHTVAREWTPNEKLHVGMLMIDLIVQHTGIVKVETMKGKRCRDKKIVLLVNPELEEWLLRQHARCELMHPSHLPMVCPPRPFEGLRGGHLTPQVSRPLVVVRDKGVLAEYTAEKMPVVFRAVNHLMAVPYEVNPDTLPTVDALWENAGEVPGAASRNDVPLPQKPTDGDPDEMAMYRVKAREIAESNLSMKGRRMDVAQTLGIAKRFQGRPIWYSLFLDFRSRIYTDCNYLTPQGSDLAKGLLRFKRAMPIGNEDGARWLMIHAANSAGIDKVSMDDRVQWTEKHRKDIEAVAADPLGYRWWAEQESPTAFLAVCHELARFWRDGYSAPTQIPVAMDGSCNGIQHLAAMSRDPAAGALVNLVPGEKPVSIYARTAEVTIRMLQEMDDPIAKLWLEYGISKDITKRPTMIIPYNGTRKATEKYIDMAVTERMQAGKFHPFGKQRKHAVFLLSKVLWDAMAEVVTGPRAVMEWTKLIAKETNKLDAPVSWRTPSGFLVRQAYRESVARRVITRLDGSRVDLVLRDQTDQMDKGAQVRATSPNWIHSLDAAALQLTICRLADQGVQDVMAIHDSYATHAPNVTLMQRELREAFVSIYESGQVMERFAADVAAASGATNLPPPPALGQLDVGGVRRSEYFFA